MIDISLCKNDEQSASGPADNFGDNGMNTQDKRKEEKEQHETDSSDLFFLEWKPIGRAFADRFVMYLIEVDRTINLSTRGIASAIPMVDLAKALAAEDQGILNETENNAKAESRTRIQRFEENAKFAKEQIEKGFPILYGLAIVGLWGALEAFVEDLSVDWIKRHPVVLQNDAIARIKVPLAEFDSLNSEERRVFLVREIASINKKSGISGFEDLLGLLGISGSVDRELRRIIFEMHQTRNLIVHRASIADRKFVESCPWLKYKTGDTISITGRQYSMFRDAAIAYVTNVALRLPKSTPTPKTELGETGPKMT